MKDRVDIGELDVSTTRSSRFVSRRIPFRSHRRRTSDFPIDTPTASLANLVYIMRWGGGVERGVEVDGTAYS